MMLRPVLTHNGCSTIARVIVILAQHKIHNLLIVIAKSNCSANTTQCFNLANTVKTCYFHCIVTSQFCNVEILFHLKFAFSQCSPVFPQVFDGQTEYSVI